jgi:hypothetical protein
MVDGLGPPGKKGHLREIGAQGFPQSPNILQALSSGWVGRGKAEADDGRACWPWDITIAVAQQSAKKSRHQRPGRGGSASAIHGGNGPRPPWEIGGGDLPQPRLALPARPGITERKARCRPSIEFGGSSLVFVALAVGAPHDAVNCRGRTTIPRRVAFF